MTVVVPMCMGPGHAAATCDLSGRGNNVGAGLHAEQGDLARRHGVGPLVALDECQRLFQIELPGDASDALGFCVTMASNHFLGLLVGDLVGKAIHPRLASQCLAQ